MERNKQAFRAVLRLQRDYDELQCVNAAELPLVAAAPVAVLVPEESDSTAAWLAWKVTIMGSPDSKFAGVLLQLNLDFPPGMSA